jgi:hypothetical protein
MRVKGAVEARGQRVQALSQSKLQVMDVAATGKSADCLAYAIVIVVQQRETLRKTEEGCFVGGLRHVEIVLVLPNGDFESVKSSHEPPNKRGGARPN